MKKKRILFVAPSSFPMVGAEANVNAKVIKLLSNFDCIVDLVCRTPKNQNYVPDREEDVFFAKLASIHTVTVNTAKDFATILRHIKAFLKFGNVYRGIDWAYDAACECDKLIVANSYDFIYTYDYPSEIVGLYVSKKYGIKWVATWNDPYIWDKYPAPYGNGFDSKISFMRQRLIIDICKTVYCNAFPSERLRDYMLKYMTGMKRDSCVILPHLVMDEFCCFNSKKLGDTLTLIHTGALGRERDPKMLLEGFKLFLNKCPNAKLNLTLMGVFERGKGNYVSDLIDEYSLEKYVTLIPPVSYSRSLEVTREYDICVVVEANLDEGIFLPSKIADYLQNSKPIFAISPSLGLLNDEYRNGIIDYFGDVKSSTSIANELLKIYDDFENGRIGNLSKNDLKYHDAAIMEIHRKQIHDRK